MNNEMINNEFETDITETINDLNNENMIDENGKVPQISAKTSVGNKAFFNSLPGASNHEKLTLLRNEYEKASAARLDVVFADNVSIIDNCLDSIKVQVEAISKGIRSEEARIKRTFLDPINSKISEYESTADDIDTLRADLDKSKKENEKFAKDVEKLTTINESNEKTIAEHIATINELTAESRDLMKSNKLINEQLEVLNRGIEDQLAEQRDNYENALKLKDNEITGLNKQIESLGLEREQLSKTEDTLRAEIKELKADRLEIENTYKKEILDLNVAKNDAEFEVKSLSMEKNKLETENNSLTNAVEGYKATQKQLEDKVNELNMDKNALGVKVDSLESLVSSHNNNIETKIEKINKLEEQLQGETKLRQEKEHEITKLNITLKDQAATIERLEKMLEAINGANNEIDAPEGKTTKTKRK